VELGVLDGVVEGVDDGALIGATTMLSRLTLPRSEPSNWYEIELPPEFKLTVSVSVPHVSQFAVAGSRICLSLVAVPAIIFFLVFQRNIMAGLTAGSLKG
jgi:hypothetical protein